MRRRKILRTALGGTATLILLAVCASMVAMSAQTRSQPKQGAKPAIAITTVPPRGEGPDRMELIAGTVSGVDVSQCKVVVFAKTDTWYVQPTIAEPYTSVEPGGRWETDTHLGYEYAALLVRPSYKAPATVGALPAVGGNVLAFARVRARQ